MCFDQTNKQTTRVRPMPIAQQLQRAQKDIAFIALSAEITAFMHQTSALVLLRAEEAQLRADGLQAPVSEELSQAHIQRVRRELATAKTRAVALVAKVEQATYPAFLARGQADALAALQALVLDLDALANFPELPQAPTPEPTPAPAPEPASEPAPESA
jgi:hypothetical protein